MAVSIKLHLSQQNPADEMPYNHEDPEHDSSEPDPKSREVQQPADADIKTSRQISQLLVPRVAFVNDSSEPVADRTNQVTEPHTSSLREMAELVRQNAAELSHSQASNQRHPKSQHKVISSHAENTTIETRTGVDVAVDVDPPRTRRVDGFADPIHELKQQRLIFGLQSSSPGVRRWLRKQRLDHEQDKSHASNNRRKISKKCQHDRAPRVTSRTNTACG
jgi:hypothetical protein